MLYGGAERRVKSSQSCCQCNTLVPCVYPRLLLQVVKCLTIYKHQLRAGLCAPVVPHIHTYMHVCGYTGLELRIIFNIDSSINYCFSIYL